MTSPTALIARRTLRPLAAACALLFVLLLAGAPAANGEIAPRICQDCGREETAEASFCSHCGARLPPLAPESGESSVQYGDGVSASVPASVAADAHAGPAPDAPAAATKCQAAAKADVSEARRRAEAGDHAAAFILFRNAQALLASGAGGMPNVASSRALAAETERARNAFCKAIPPAGRMRAEADAMRALEGYFRGESRIPLGRAWVPADWPALLPPPDLAAVMISLPAVCKACGGSGATPCRTCGGRGRVHCSATGCKGGFVFVKPRNSLTPKNDIVVKEKCRLCGGSALVQCGQCMGRGAVNCAKCGGAGEAPACNACNGAGLDFCKKCARDGVSPDCPQCKGSGRVLCRKCGGGGRTQK